MKPFPVITARTSLTLLVFCSVFVSHTEAKKPHRQSNRKPIVVELFTSEGCSTCPPADALLRKLEEQQPVPGARVIALEEHVDYWNHQGWIDPFSSPEWTQGQEAYVFMLKNGEPYTPEMVVDGQSQFVGSNEREAELTIERVASGVKTDVSIMPGKLDGKNSQNFDVSVGKLAGDAPGDVVEVWLAVTEDGLHSSVSGGENGGRVLYHAAVVRSLHKIGAAHTGGESLSFTGDPRVKFSSKWKRKSLRVVVFVQKRKSRKILCAASTRLTQ